MGKIIRFAGGPLSGMKIQVNDGQVDYTHYVKGINDGMFDEFFYEQDKLNDEVFIPKNSTDPISAASTILARADALAAIQRRLFSCDHVQLEAIMKTVYRKPVVVVSEVDETEQYLETLKRFE